jgi:trigger factor
LNIQTEIQPDHTARLIVQPDEGKFATARQKAARTLSSKVNIPGFRKGKVPMRILINYVGEGALAEEAIDVISQELYVEALKASGVEPYAPGKLVDVQFDTTPPTVIYQVSLKPTVDIGDYRSAVIMDYAPPSVEDAEVDQALREMQEEYALVEESSRPAELGNRVVMALHSYFIDSKIENSDDEIDELDDEISETGEDADDEHQAHAIDDYMHADQEVYWHEHEMEYLLSDENDVKLAPGFSAALVGMRPGETREFDITFPDDHADEELAGRTVHFVVHIQQVQVVTLPVLNDDLVARVTKDEEQPLTLLEMRIRIRENLQTKKEQEYRAEFARQFIDKLVETAVLAYPEEMIVEQADRMLGDFDQRLRRAGLTLDDYIKVNNKTPDVLYAEWRPHALKAAQRMLVMNEMIRREQLTVSDQEVSDALEGFVEQFEEGLRPLVRKQIEADNSMHITVMNSLLEQALFERIALIAKGQAPLLAETTSSEPARVNRPDEAADTESAVTNDN